MNNTYVYQQFGVWWVFAENAQPSPIQLSGPYPTKKSAEEALDLLMCTTPVRVARATG